jgi:hypothetical protein
MTVATLLLTCLVFLFIGWTAPNYFVTALSIGGIVCIASSNGGTTSQDLKTGFLVGATPRLQQIAILIGALASALVLGPILLKLNDSYTVYVPAMTFAPVPQDVARMDLGPAAATLPPFSEGIKPEPRNFRILKSDAADAAQPIAGLGAGEYLVNEEGRIAYKVERHFAPDLRADPAQLGQTEKLKGVQGAGDQNAYRVWQRLDPAGGPAQKYLVNDQGVVTYLVDPGINGTQRFRPDGSAVTKFDAPKATLMSYIIKGILSRELPWALVLLGVFIAIVLEMSGIPSLAFAVGVYLPLSSSSPIFIGGMVRWLVDRYLRRHKFRGKNLSPEELVAEGDKSSGVLLASGYIAGGALAGIIIAFMAGVPALAGFSRAVEDWSATSNPFYHGPNADLLALIPFTVLAGPALSRGARSRPRDEARCGTDELRHSVTESSLPAANLSSRAPFCACEHLPQDAIGRSSSAGEEREALASARVADQRARPPRLWRGRDLSRRLELPQRTQTDLPRRSQVAESQRASAAASRPGGEANAGAESARRSAQARAHDRAGEGDAAGDARPADAEDCGKRPQDGGQWQRGEFQRGRGSADDWRRTWRHGEWCAGDILRHSRREHERGDHDRRLEFHVLAHRRRRGQQAGEARQGAELSDRARRGGQAGAEPELWHAVRHRAVVRRRVSVEGAARARDRREQGRCDRAYPERRRFQQSEEEAGPPRRHAARLCPRGSVQAEAGDRLHDHGRQRDGAINERPIEEDRRG